MQKIPPCICKTVFPKQKSHLLSIKATLFCILFGLSWILWFLCTFRNHPHSSHHNSAFNASFFTINRHSSLRYIPFFAQSAEVKYSILCPPYKTTTCHFNYIRIREHFQDKYSMLRTLFYMLTAWSTLRFGRRKATVHRTVCAPQLCLKAIEKALTIELSPTIRAFGKVA